MYKLVVVVRTDLSMSKGKICAQVGHAVLQSFLQSKKKDLIDKWLAEGGKKVILRVDGLDNLLRIKEKAEKRQIPTALIQDAGMTEVDPGTITCLGLGPEKESKLDVVSGDLKPL